jgi:hypothetical protein
VGSNTITNPTSAGTLALTSQLSAYAALSGANFTGAISAPTINGIPMTGTVVSTNIWTIGIGSGAAPVATTVGGVYAFGWDSQNATTASLHDNTSMGEETLMSNSTGISESAFGSQAEKLMSSTSGYNTAAGTFAIRGTLTPANNTGSYNSAFGAVSLSQISSASYNAVLGYYGLFNDVTGSYNTCVGAQCGEFITGGSTANTTPSYGVFLGYNTEASAASDTNEIVIGASAVGNGSNTATIGNSSTTSIHINGSLINANGTLLSSSLTGAHGAPASDVKVQLSDGTGTSGYAAVYDTNGGLTNGSPLIADVQVTVSSSTTINANSCDSGHTATMTGVTTTMAFSFTATTDTHSVTGWGAPAAGVLYITDYPTAGTLNYYICNNTASNITTGASVTFNVSAR